MKFDVEHGAEIEELLRLLDGALQIEDGAEPIELLVCGGAALLVLGLTDRATQDVDVLALIEDQEDVAAKPLPDFLQRAVERVARDRGLPAEWLNSGPADMQQWGLPRGCLERATRIQYGEFLAISYLDRLDQIHLKLYATVDQGDGKHLSDLQALEPNTAEIELAAEWCQQHDPSEGFRMMLSQLLGQIGFKDVARKL